MSYPLATWRLIIHTPFRGAWNMAVDEAIMDAILKDIAPPTLRLYAWAPPCLSLGGAQPIAEVDKDALSLLGWDLVRRPTGGRAILHADELTYSIIGKEEDPRLKGGVLESYRRISSALLEALRLLGINAETTHYEDDGTGPSGVKTQLRQPKNQNPVCFEVPSNYEITYQGKKIIGSAQLRRKGCVLQHGTFPLYGDIRRIIRCLVFPDVHSRKAAEVKLVEHAITAEAILGFHLKWQLVIEAFARGFSSALNISFERGELSPFEVERANHLLTTKYTLPEWNERV